MKSIIDQARPLKKDEGLNERLLRGLQEVEVRATDGLLRVKDGATVQETPYMSPVALKKAFTTAIESYLEQGFSFAPKTPTGPYTPNGMTVLFLDQDHGIDRVIETHWDFGNGHIRIERERRLDEAWLEGSGRPSDYPGDLQDVLEFHRGSKSTFLTFATSMTEKLREDCFEVALVDLLPGPKRLENVTYEQFNGLLGELSERAQWNTGDCPEAGGLPPEDLLKSLTDF